MNWLSRTLVYPTIVVGALLPPTPAKQTAKPVPAPKKPTTAAAKTTAPRMLRVTVTSDLACTFTVDGGSPVDLKAGEPTIVLMSPRAHKLEAVSSTASEDRWESTIDLSRPGAKPAVDVQLLPIQTRRIEAQRLAREARIAEEERRPPELTGIWEVNTEKSDFATAKGLRAYKKVTYRVQHNAESLSVHAILDEKPSEQEDWVVDGRVRANSGFGQDETRTATWEGRTLVTRKDVVACVLRACEDGRTMHIVVAQRWQQTPGDPDEIKIQDTLISMDDIERRVVRQATRTLVAARTSRTIDSPLPSPQRVWTTDSPQARVAGTWKMALRFQGGGPPIGGDCVIKEMVFPSIAASQFEGECSDEGTNWTLNGAVKGSSVTWSTYGRFGEIRFEGAFVSRNFVVGKIAMDPLTGSATAVRRLPTQ